MRFKKRAWSRLVRIQLDGKLRRSAKGMTTGRGSRRRWAFQCRRVISSARCRTSRPRSVRSSLWRSWILFVCSSVSSIWSSKQRVAFSWFTEDAVVASMKAARASTVKTFVRRFPVWGSFTGAAAMSFFRLCSTRIE